nr:DUF4857 domain-containing protein [uncultured Pseudodesulfovibrio sp.]
MVSAARISAVLVLIFSLSMVLPGLFAKATSVKVRVPILYFSPILERFVMQGGSTYYDEEGMEMGLREYRRSLPFIYHADLTKWKEFPKEVGGVPVSAEETARLMQFMRISPRDINIPSFGLHMLLESSPEGANLELAQDMFRLGDGIEFLRCADNSLDQEKSARFTAAMVDAGFRFPAREVGGNPDSLKAFDWGYFLIDDTNTLFHLMMVQGEPRCINTGRQFEQKVRDIIVYEHLRKEYYGMVITEGNAYVVSCDDYKLIRMPLTDYDLDQDMLMLLSTPLNHILQQRKGDVVLGTAMNDNWESVHEYTLKVDRGPKIIREKIGALLFPFKLETSSPYTQFKLLDLRDFYIWPLWNAMGVLLCIGAYLIIHRFRFRVNPPVWELILLGFTGVYGLIALVAVGRINPGPSHKFGATERSEVTGIQR